MRTYRLLPLLTSLVFPLAACGAPPPSTAEADADLSGPGRHVGSSGSAGTWGEAGTGGTNGVGAGGGSGGGVTAGSGGSSGSGVAGSGVAGSGVAGSGIAGSGGSGVAGSGNGSGGGNGLTGEDAYEDNDEEPMAITLPMGFHGLWLGDKDWFRPGVSGCAGGELFLYYYRQSGAPSTLIVKDGSGKELSRTSGSIDTVQLRYALADVGTDLRIGIESDEIGPYTLGLDEYCPEPTDGGAGGASPGTGGGGGLAGGDAGLGGAAGAAGSVSDPGGGGSGDAGAGGWQAEDQYEPNNTKQAAAPLDGSAYLDSADPDWFTFQSACATRAYLSFGGYHDKTVDVRTETATVFTSHGPLTSVTLLVEGGQPHTMGVWGDEPGGGCGESYSWTLISCPGSAGAGGSWGAAGGWGSGGASGSGASGGAGSSGGGGSASGGAAGTSSGAAGSGGAAAGSGGAAAGSGGSTAGSGGAAAGSGGAAAGSGGSTAGGAGVAGSGVGGAMAGQGGIGGTGTGAGGNAAGSPSGAGAAAGTGATTGTGAGGNAAAGTAGTNGSGAGDDQQPAGGCSVGPAQTQASALPLAGLGALGLILARRRKRASLGLAPDRGSGERRKPFARTGARGASTAGRLPAVLTSVDLRQPGAIVLFAPLAPRALRSGHARGARLRDVSIPPSQPPSATASGSRSKRAG